MTPPDQPDQPSKLHIDSDWKAQAQAEKQKLQEELEGQQGPDGGPEEIPPGDFKTLVSTLVSQALLYMGAIPDPMTGRRIAHLELAQHHIDLLGTLDEKTKGNLDEEERLLLSQALHELRLHFTQLAKQVAAHQAQQAQQKLKGGGGLATPGSGPSGGPSPFGGIIDPTKR